jgi:hypothetical protein
MPESARPAAAQAGPTRTERRGAGRTPSPSSPELSAGRRFWACASSRERQPADSSAASLCAWRDPQETETKTRPSASSRATRSDTSHSRSVTPAVMAGQISSVRVVGLPCESPEYHGVKLIAAFYLVPGRLVRYRRGDFEQRFDHFGREDLIGKLWGLPRSPGTGSHDFPVDCVDWCCLDSDLVHRCRRL